MTRANGLHCVYGTCRGFPATQNLCHPACVYQGGVASQFVHPEWLKPPTERNYDGFNTMAEALAHEERERAAMWGMQ